jgi:predicted nuclease with TOPRIM domain
MADFLELINNLAAANQTAALQIENNRSFNTRLTQDLTTINQQIRIIIEKIKGLKNRLQELQGLVETNQADITRIEGEKIAISQELKQAESERDTIRAELQSNEQARTELIAQIKAIDAEKQKELSQLQAELAGIQQENQKNRKLTETEKAEFQKQMQTTMNQIEQVKKAIEDEKKRLEQELNDLNIRHTQLVGDLNSSRQEVADARAQYNNLEKNCDTIKAENTQLKDNLNNARGIIIKATELLNSLSQEQDYGKIREQIDIINEEIREINGLLDIQPQAVARQQPQQGAPSRRPRSGQGRGIPLLNVKEMNIKMDGKTYENSVLNNSLLFLSVNDDSKEWDIIYDDYIIANSLPENEVKQSIEYLINNLTPEKKKILSTETETWVKPPFGGKLRRHRKSTIKTKRKQIKQKGGYHYSERSKRRSLTTTSSSRRSKRRTKRTTRG